MYALNKIRLLEPSLDQIDVVAVAIVSFAHGFRQLRTTILLYALQYDWKIDSIQNFSVVPRRDVIGYKT